MNMPRMLRLLLIEDEPGDAQLMRLTLQNNDCPVELYGVADAFEALKFLRHTGEAFQAAPRPDLILLDLQIPGKNGLELLAEIKQDNSLQGIPVVVVSGSPREADVQAAYSLGAAGYIPKLSDLNEFTVAIQRLSQYWSYLVRLPEIQK